MGWVLRRTGVFALNAETTFLTWVKGERGDPCGRRRVKVEAVAVGVVVAVSVFVTDPVRPVKVDTADLEGVPLYPLTSDCERECVPGVCLESEEPDTELGGLGPETAEVTRLFVGEDEREP